MGKQDVCPGCSRHCPLSHVRCKYGQKYAQKLQKIQETATEADRKPGKTKRKWEKYAPKGTTAWKLLWTSRCLKRALREGKTTAAQLHLALSDEEQAQLHTLLEKIAKNIE